MVADIASCVADFFLQTNRFYVAIQLCKEMLTLIEFFENVSSSKMVGLRLLIYLSLGPAYIQVDSFHEAKSTFKLGLRASEKLNDKISAGICSFNIGCAYQVLGRCDKSIKHFKKALQINAAIGNIEREAKTYWYLGRVYQALGQSEEARDCYLKSINRSRGKGYKYLEAAASIDLSKVFRCLGEIEKEKLNLEKALKIWDEIDDACGRALVLALMGMNADPTDQSGKFFEFLEKSLQISRQANDSKGEGSTCLGLGGVLAALQQFDEALPYLEKATELSYSSGDRDTYEQACLWLADVHLSLGHCDRATEYRERAIQTIKDSGFRKMPRSWALMRAAVGYAAEGFTEQAYNISLESIEYFESELEPLSDEHKVSFGSKTDIFFVSVYEFQSSLLLDLGRDLDSLIAAEQGRARVLRELLTKRYSIEGQVKPVNEEALVGLVERLKKEQIIVFIAQLLVEFNYWIISGDNNGKLEQLKSSTTLLDLLKAKPRDDIKSFANERETEVEDRSLSELYDCDLKSENEESVDYTTNTVERLLELDAENSANIENRWYKTLIAPIADRIENRELVLVPAPNLLMVPYAALQDDSGKYLSNTCKIRIIPSLTTLKLILDSPPDYHSETGVLIVGDPQINHVTPLSQLKAARQEAKEIADLLEVEPLLGEQATKEEVLRRITDVCLVHIAAHGDAERGEIACAPNPSSPQNPTKEDYMLTMGDVAKVRIRAKLVVLSCCHRAKGKIMRAEGVVGIARAFIASGARSVLVSLWAVDDKATKQFMIRFYGHLKRDKMSASEALHQTMKWMRESETKRYTVREWAPFVLIGDDVTLDL